MISKEVDEAIKEGKRLIDFWNNYNYATEEGKEKCLYSAKSINIILSYIEKQDKIIDLMAEYLADIDFDECCAEIPEPCLGCSWEDYEPHTNCIKEYFRKKVENEK